MMGDRTVAQVALFHRFSLERHVPGGHLLRSIGPVRRTVGRTRASVAVYSEMGQSSIDPELIVGARALFAAA